jgi:phosphatidylinositol-3-phosphatase
VSALVATVLGTAAAGVAPAAADGAPGRPQPVTCPAHEPCGTTSFATMRRASTTSPVGASDPCVGAPRPKTYDHVIWIWFENKAPIVGSPSAPYFTSIAGQCGLAANYHGVTHPSLPNYLAATGGSTFAIVDDDPPSSHPITAASIFSQVRASGRQWRSYEESMPANCALGSSGAYAVKHNPAAYYLGIRTDCSSWDVPMGTTSSGAFRTALNAGTLPAFSFVTPNMCNDMHDCSVATGDAWLKAWMARILGSAVYGAGRTAVVITFDEGVTTDLTNAVSTIVVAPSVRRGTRSGTWFNHYSLLRTTEEMLGLPAMLGKASTAASMRSAFHL